MRMINKLLGRFGLQLVKRADVETASAANEDLQKVINDLQREMTEMRERNRELLKRMARHTASAHYYRKNYLRLKNGDQETIGS